MAFIESQSLRLVNGTKFAGGIYSDRGRWGYNPRCEFEPRRLTGYINRVW